MIRKKLHRYLLLAGLLITAGAGVYYYHLTHTPRIYQFVEQRDTHFILDIFKHNWHWLVSEYSTDFSPEYMLANRASSQKLEHRGNLTIKTLYLSHEPLGFVAYYKKNFYQGFLLFLAIREEYRGKGYAYQLLASAIADMQNWGVTKVRLVTRTTNEPAQKLYKQFGFDEVENDGAFVTFEYTIKA